MKKNKTKIWLLILGVLVLIVIGLLYIYKNWETINNSAKLDPDRLVFEHEIVGDKMTKVNDISKSAKLFDNVTLDDEGVSSYDGYTIDGRVVSHDGKVILTLDKKVKYAPVNDDNSKYIYVTCPLDSECQLGTLLTDEYAYIEYYDGQEDIYVIYDINTGTILTTIKDYLLMGDYPRLGAGETIITNSSKYLVAVQDDEYGLVDFYGKKIIDFVYDDLVTIDDDTMIAKKDGKFGVIDSTNKTLIDFKYDGLMALDNYLIALKDGKLGVIDQDDKVMIPFTKEVANINENGYSLRPCCGDENSFLMMIIDDEIVINYYDATEKKSDSRYDYDIDYLVINGDGTHKYYEEYQEKLYNFGNDYYYMYPTIDIDSKIKIYDKDKKIINEDDCGEGVTAYVEGFVDHENIAFTCSEDMDIVTKYFNVKNQKYVSEKDVKDFIGDMIALENVQIVDNGKEKLVVNDQNKLLLKLKNDDRFYYLYDGYYKVIHQDETFDYYQYE